MNIIKFGADWCAPCKMLEPIIEQMQKKYPDLTVDKVNVDTHPDIAAQSHVRSLPTLIFYRNGNEVSRISGATTAHAIERHINA